MWGWHWLQKKQVELMTGWVLINGFLVPALARVLSLP